MSITQNLRHRLLLLVASLLLAGGFGALPALAISSQTYVDTGWVTTTPRD